MDPMVSGLDPLNLVNKGWGRNYPTLPSKVRAKSFWASTANSIGSWFNTSLA